MAIYQPENTTKLRWLTKAHTSSPQQGLRQVTVHAVTLPKEMTKNMLSQELDPAILQYHTIPYHTIPVYTSILPQCIGAHHEAAYSMAIKAAAAASVVYNPQWQSRLRGRANAIVRRGTRRRSRFYVIIDKETDTVERTVCLQTVLYAVARWEVLQSVERIYSWRLYVCAYVCFFAENFSPS